MFDEVLGKLRTDPPRSIELLQGLKWRHVLRSSIHPFLMVYLVFFTVMPIIMVSAMPEGRLQIGRTRIAEGRVVAIDEPTVCPASQRHITYVFRSSEGTEISGSGTLVFDTVNTPMHAGDPVEIKYLVSDPSINKVALGVQMVPEPPVLPFLIFPLMAGLIVFTVSLPRVRDGFRARKIAKYGQIKEATIVFVRPNSGAAWPGLAVATSASVFIRFRGPCEEMIEAEAKCFNGWLLSHLAPGAMVPIGYMPSKPKSVSLLAAYLR